MDLASAARLAVSTLAAVWEASKPAIRIATRRTMGSTAASRAPMMPSSGAGRSHGPVGAYLGTAERGFRNPHAAAKPFNCTLHAGKAQAIADFPACGRTELHEGLKYAAALRRRNAGPVIFLAQLIQTLADGKRDFDAAVGVPACVVQQ